MKYQAVIFDLDGVICHTDSYHYLAWKQIADENNIYFDEQINNRLRGVSREKSFEIILERSSREFAPEEKAGITNRKNEIYKELLKSMSPADIEPEVITTLNTLKEAGVLLGIGSSSKNARLILEKVGLEGFFDAISDGVGLRKSKPDPEVFIRCAKMLGVLPEHCLVVEDAVAGVQAAKAAGMDCAAVSDAADSGIADYNLVRFSDLLDIAV